MGSNFTERITSEMGTAKTSKSSQEVRRIEAISINPTVAGATVVPQDTLLLIISIVLATTMNSLQVTEQRAP